MTIDVIFFLMKHDFEKLLPLSINNTCIHYSCFRCVMVYFCYFYAQNIKNVNIL